MPRIGCAYGTRHDDCFDGETFGGTVIGNAIAGSVTETDHKVVSGDGPPTGAVQFLGAVALRR